MKKIPYGQSNYELLKTRGEFYFVDKTPFIEKIEDLGSRYLFFLRPRRFGKSLFLSMLENYYDINKKDKFDVLFRDTYIKKKSYLIKKRMDKISASFFNPKML